MATGSSRLSRILCLVLCASLSAAEAVSADEVDHEALWRAEAACVRDTSRAHVECYRDSARPLWDAFGLDEAQRQIIDALYPKLLREAEYLDAGSITSWMYARRTERLKKKAYRSAGLRYPNFRLSDWVRPPSPKALAARLPRSTLIKAADGNVVLRCLITSAGAAVDCQVESETPPGYGLGEALLAMSKDFQMKPAKIDGRLIDRMPAMIVVYIGDIRGP